MTRRRKARKLFEHNVSVPSLSYGRAARRYARHVLHLSLHAGYSHSHPFTLLVAHRCSPRLTTDRSLDTPQDSAASLRRHPRMHQSAHTRLLLARSTAVYLELELDADTGTEPRHQAEPSRLLRGSSPFSICEHSSLRAWLVTLRSGRALPMPDPRGINTGQGVLCAWETEDEYVQLTSTQSRLVHRIRSYANITLLF
jgi:hypothetical protein